MLERQCSHWPQPAQVHKRKVLLNQPNFLSFPTYDKVTHLVNQGKPVSVSFNFSKVFKTVSHSTLGELFITELDKSVILGWVNNWLMDWAQRITVNIITSGWLPVTSSVPQCSVLETVLLNIFISCLDTGIKKTLSDFTGGTKLGGAGDSLKSRKTLQKN